MSGTGIFNRYWILRLMKVEDIIFKIFCQSFSIILKAAHKSPRDCFSFVLSIESEMCIKITHVYNCDKYDSPLLIYKKWVLCSN